MGYTYASIPSVLMYFTVASERTCRRVQIRLLLEGQSFCLVMFISSYAFETKSTHKRVSRLLTDTVFILVGCLKFSIPQCYNTQTKYFTPVISTTFILCTVVYMYVRATCFDLVGHPQALQENRSKVCLVYPHRGIPNAHKFQLLTPRCSSS